MKSIISNTPLARLSWCLLFFAGLMSVGCRSDGPKWVEQDLMSHGLPVKVMGPSDMEVRKQSFSGDDEFQLTGEDYGMNVFVFDASSSDLTQVTTELKDIIKNNKYFSSVVHENPNGFVYQLQIDSAYSVYGFRKVLLQGSKQIIFQNPPMSRLTQEAAMALYEAAPE